MIAVKEIMEIQYPKSQLLTQLRQQLLCPITHDYIKQAVITQMGITYQKQALEQWLKAKQTDPATNKKLEHKLMIPNITLMKYMEKVQKILPTVQYELDEKNMTIQNLQNELQKTKQSLELQRERIEILEKDKNVVKKINKHNTKTSEQYLTKLRKLQRNNHIFRIKLDQLNKQKQMKQEKIQSLRQTINSLEIKLNNFSNNQVKQQKSQQQQRIYELQLNLSVLEQTYTKINRNYNILKKNLQQFINSINQKLRAFIKHQKLYLQILENQLDQKDINNRYQIYVEKKREMEIKKDKYKIDPVSKDLFEERFAKLVKFLNFINYHNKLGFKADFNVCTFTNENGQIQIGYSLCRIPILHEYSKQFKQIDWSQIVTIMDQKTDDNKWKVFTLNNGRFPRLKKLWIQNPQLRQFNPQDLKKFPNLNLIRFTCGNNTQLREKLIRFKSQNEQYGKKITID